MEPEGGPFRGGGLWEAVQTHPEARDHHAVLAAGRLCVRPFASRVRSTGCGDPPATPGLAAVTDSFFSDYLAQRLASQVSHAALHPRPLPVSAFQLALYLNDALGILGSQSKSFLKIG